MSNYVKNTFCEIFGLFVCCFRLEVLFVGVRDACETRFWSVYASVINWFVQF